MFALCESDGYMLRLRVYTGKEDATNNTELVLPDEVQHFTKPEKMVVFHLLPYLDKGHTIYMDNWYSSVVIPVPASALNHSMWNPQKKTKPL